MKKKAFKSIKSKWLASSLSLLFISLVILEILFGIFIKAFFYSGVRNNIDNASSIFANVLSRYNLKEINVFKDAAKNQIENLSTKSMWVSVFDYNDDLVVSSIGLDVPGDKYCNDYMQARKHHNLPDCLGDYPHLNHCRCQIDSVHQMSLPHHTHHHIHMDKNQLLKALPVYLWRK